MPVVFFAAAVWCQWPMPSSIDCRAAERAFEQHFDCFERFVLFFCTVLQRPDPLRQAACRESYRHYVPHYYRRVFGPGIDRLSRRHLAWLRRLAPVLTLPAGARVLDCGGGYGLDAIFLAACGYEVVFFELTPHHIGVCEYFRHCWESAYGSLQIRSVLASRLADRRAATRADTGAIGIVDAVLLDEVAHHVEPVADLFSFCAGVLRAGGELFLLEPNCFSPVVQAHFVRTRGMSTVVMQVDEQTGERRPYGNEHIRSCGHWQRLASAAGLRLRGVTYVVPYWMGSRDSAVAAWRRRLERAPIVRSLAATHVTLRFEKV
jgi:SAM-dependent methyltransferase